MKPEEQRDLSLRLQGIAASLEDVFAEQYGRKILFTLVIWGDGKAEEHAQYVSNADREGVANALKELLKYWELGGEDVPEHVRH